MFFPPPPPPPPNEAIPTPLPPPPIPGGRAQRKNPREVGSRPNEPRPPPPARRRPPTAQRRPTECVTIESSWSTVTTPCATSDTHSRKIAACSRFATNPPISLRTTCGVLPSAV